MAKTPLILDNETSLPIERLEALATQVQLIFPDSAEEAMEEVVRLEEKKQLASLKQGLLLLQVKSQCSHGEFKTKLANYTFCYEAARQCMSIAQMFLALPDSSKSNARCLLNMNHTQLREMAKLPIQVLDKLDEEAIEGLSDLSSRELAKEVKRLRLEKAEVEDKAAAAINELNLLQLKTRQTERMGWPELVCQIRENCLGKSSVADVAANESAAEVNALLNARHLSPDERLAAARAVWHAWSGVCAGIGSMLSMLEREFAGDLAGSENLPSYSPTEWEHAMANRQYMLSMYEFQKGAK
jgi:hypothetical protein